MFRMICFILRRFGVRRLILKHHWEKSSKPAPFPEMLYVNFCKRFGRKWINSSWTRLLTRSMLGLGHVSKHISYIC